MTYRPLRCAGINLVGAMPRNRGQLGEQMLKATLEHNPDLIQSVETDDVRIARVLDPAEWWWWHRTGPNLDGVMIAGRRDRTTPGQHSWAPGAPASPVNAPRPILHGIIRVDANGPHRLGEPESWRFHAAVLHLPKPGGGQRAAGVMLERLAELDVDEEYADWNRRRSTVAARRPGTVAMRQVVGVSARRSLKVSRVRAVDVLPRTAADDHPLMLWDLAPRK